MKKELVGLLFIIVFGLLISIKPPTFPYQHPPKDVIYSVKPIQFKGVDQATGEDALGNKCTAGFINQEKALWITAAHCIPPSSFFLDGLPAFPVEVDKEKDLAVIFSYGVGGIPLNLSNHEMRAGEELTSAGYPFGSTTPIFVKGPVASPLFSFPNTPEAFSIWDIRCGRGQSGSPVVDEEGRLISVLQIGSIVFPIQFSPICGGAPFTFVKEFAEKFFPLKS